MSRRLTNRNERLGVSKCQVAFVEEYNWIFREQPIEDLGVDAIVEVVKDDDSTGILFALQIKSGESFFRNETLLKDGFTFSFSDTHYRYWTKLKIPVVIVFYHPIKEELYWFGIDERTTVSTGKNWKISIPYSNTLTSATEGNILEFVTTNYTSDDWRLGRLKSDKYIMSAIKNNSASLVIDAERWINKSHGRTSLTITLEGASGKHVLQTKQFYPGSTTIATVITHVFPWAALSIDENFYENFEREQYDVEWTHYDKEDDKLYNFSDNEEFKLWQRQQPSFRPYMNSQGEIDLYRLKAKLNPLGEAFLLVEDFCFTGQLPFLIDDPDELDFAPQDDLPF